MVAEREKLLGEFPKVSAAEWRALVETDLRGAAFDKRLVSQSREGFNLQPLYTRDDQLGEGNGAGFPGFAPFERGVALVGTDGRGWKIRQEHVHPDADVTRRAIAEEISQGAGAVTLCFDCATRAGCDSDSAEPGVAQEGLLGCSTEQLKSLFDDSALGSFPVSLEVGASSLGVAALWIAVLENAGVSIAGVEGHLNADPLAALAVDGLLPTSVDGAFAEMADLANWASEKAPNLCAVNVSSIVYHDAGATASIELACALATGTAYLRSLTEAGISLAQCTRTMSFSFAVGTDLFLEIAKLRAARLAWFKVIAACGGTEADFSMRIHARTSGRTKTVYDPWVNLLRSTVEGFAGAVGGADDLATSPFDEAIGMPDEFSRRVALNSQVLLREESNLKRVIDPAGGSWYVEWLTDRLVREAWKKFQQIESAGGIQAALISGMLEDEIGEAAAAKRKAVATRRDPITGVSEFPNIGEKRIEKEKVDLDAIRKAAEESLRSFRSRRDDASVKAALAALEEASGTGRRGVRMARAVDAAKAGATLGELSAALREGESERIAPLRSARDAAEFEALRDACDAALVSTGQRPSIFLANLGAIAQHKARASFAQNLFEAGGIAAIDNDGFASVDEIVEAFQKGPASSAVICGSDEQYEEFVGALAPRLRAAGARQLFVAGRPGEREAADCAAGVDGFIFVGTDVLETVRGFLQSEGVLQ